jgi:hypothetical protein
MTDTPFTAEEIRWAGRLAAQLRFLQADFADLTPAERQPYYDEEIQHALREIVPENRSRYLAALGEEFPTFNFSQPALEAEPADTSPEALVEALVRIAPRLPKQKLAEFGVQLQNAGYVGLKSTTLVDGPPPEFQKLFGLADGQSVDLQRLYRLTTVMADFYFRLEVFAWSVWQQVGSQSRIRKDIGVLNDPRKLGGRYLTGDAEVSAEQIKTVVEKTRQLIAGLLGALGGAGRIFANRFAADFSPEHVLTVAKLDSSLGSGMFGNDEVRAWRKFKQLFQGQTEEVIEERLQEAIAHSAEGLMRGLNRNDP